MGLGVMGLHSYLLLRGLKYSSKQGQKEIDKLFSFIKHTAYDASINLAIEKGAFPAYSERILESGYLSRMKRGIRSKIREHGLRNCALLTIAPTGTTAMVHGVSSGIEPYTSAAYRRRYWDNEVRDNSVVVEAAFQKYPEVFEGAADLTPKDHFEVQRIVQKHIDNAVSKTINLPKDYTSDNLSKLWLEYLPEIKGSTFYRFGSRENEPIEPIGVQEARNLLEEELVFDPSCKSGACDV